MKKMYISCAVLIAPYLMGMQSKNVDLGRETKRVDKQTNLLLGGAFMASLALKKGASLSWVQVAPGLGASLVAVKTWQHSRFDSLGRQKQEALSTVYSKFDSKK